MSKVPLVRLDKLLANLGYGSRRDIQLLVRGRRIKLDGVALEAADQKLALTADLPERLEVDGALCDPLPGLVLMMHKPLGMTCSHDEAGPLVYDLLPDRWRQRDPVISSAGRLDKETSGLLLLTDDGALLHRLISPKAHVPKCYRATLARPLRGDEGALFASGTLMLESESKPLLPAEFEAIGPHEARLTIVEGRYHQVRRMFAAAGNHVEALHRERIGTLALDPTLEPGAYRALTPEEVAQALGQ